MTSPSGRREPPFGPYGWHLLDAEDDMRIYSARDLDAIEAWLDTDDGPQPRYTGARIAAYRAD
ncbi:hypothetical protein ACLMAJ_12695 [Nocardia sp. KC 131]|uniref:hypothetical protein n=1 Tax=Nocardia arseniciresistens TaxID=3392119 RepID=UPI00398EE998